MEQTHSQYLDWAKARALKKLDAGDLILALASIVIDLTTKGPLCFPPGYIAVRVGAGVQFVLDENAIALRKLIEGFA